MGVKKRLQRRNLLRYNVSAESSGQGEGYGPIPNRR